ncbi:MAG: 16S rRNA (uracil(1498)-N(3))-methyltransferase [Bacteroidaceae bacterium]|nr:16S rRNA (uracil(1498)-N(3))-methyltransferase [Bacteroidaceae bacterium]
MKEVRYFYVPDALNEQQLPEDEAQHAVRVLRMQPDDEMVLIDGVGNFHDAVITEVGKKYCRYRITATRPQQKVWQGHLHLAMSPTKNMDRTEWFVEKATEIGFDELTFLRCQFSERTVVKSDRIEKILISAMKQSRKAEKPVLNDMVAFKSFIESVASSNFYNGLNNKFICHCYEDTSLSEKKRLIDVLQPRENALVLVGPEGDFSIEEVRMAEAAGFQSVSLGESRLRTETAALVAVHLMNLVNARR